VDVDPVEKGTGYPPLILTDLLRRAAALPAGIAIISARTGIHSRDEHESCRVSYTGGSAGYGHTPVLERLSQGFQGIFPEFRQFVEEEDAVVGKADLPGLR
jgi:hypothetical protein